MLVPAKVQIYDLGATEKACARHSSSLKPQPATNIHPCIVFSEQAGGILVPVNGPGDNGTEHRQAELSTVGMSAPGSNS